MDPLTDVAIPAVTFLAMAVVGLEMVPADLATVVRRPKRLAVATLAQAFLLPLVGFAVIAALDPPTHRAVGLVVIAACPAGAFSNFFTALARGQTALSVALTTTCTLVAIVTLPVVTTVGFTLFVAETEAVRPPVLLMIGQLVLLLLVPLAFGMALRRFRAPFWRKHHPRLQRGVLVTVVALLIWIFVDHAPSFAAEALPGVAAAGLFLVPTMVLGEILGRALGAAPAERIAYVFELGFRNLGVATVVTVTVLRQPDFLAFATVFFVTAVLLALVAVAVFRRPR